MKKAIALTLIIVGLSLLIPFEVSPTKADATSDFSWRNWANVEVVYLGEGSITLKLTFEILGYSLHNNTDVVVSTVKSGEGWIVKTGAVALKAWYSNDKNMTAYEYTLSSQDTDIRPSGYFPLDSWEITTHIVTQFPVQFDDNIEFSATPSPNYFCKYYVSAVQSNLIDHVLLISIQHPSSFAFFIYVTYLLPFFLLLVLFLFLTRILYTHWNKIDEVKNNLLIVSIGSIVFIPVYQLPLAELKIPFLITLLDSLFIGLFIAYFSFITVIIRKENQVNSNPNSKPNQNNKEQIEFSQEKNNENSEEKIDRLLNAFEENKQERKRERILSKIDGLYSLLIAFITFTVGIIISQHDVVAFNVILLFPLVGVIVVMFASYVMGFKGMVNDSLEQRISAWCLFVPCLVWFATVVFLVSVASFYREPLTIQLITAIVAIPIGILTYFLPKNFTNWMEKKLGSLLNQKIEVWEKIRKGIMYKVFIVLCLTFVLTITIFLIQLISVLSSLS